MGRSNNHNLNLPMTNLSHVVNYLYFGHRAKSPLMGQKSNDEVNADTQNFAPLDDSVFAVSEVHHAYHHYMKIVTTQYQLPGSHKEKVYQMLATNQVMHYQHN